MPDPELEVESNFEIGGGAVAAEQLPALLEPPTAIFCVNDNMALELGTRLVVRDSTAPPRSS